MLDRVYMKKTRRGHVLKIVREHYLREDISCGSLLCTNKNCIQSFGTSKTLLDKDPPSLSKSFPKSHYIIPDTNIILHQLDVLENQVFKNVIICQTVLQEVKHRSVSCYQRIVQLLNSPDRKFFCFINEFHKDTYVERNENETSNDRNDRAIRVTCKFYKEHLKIDAVLLTDDIGNKKLAIQENLSAATCKEYIQSLGQPDLLDLIAAREEKTDELSEKTLSNAAKMKEIIFPEHLSLSEIQTGLKSGKLLQGSFQAARDNYLEANVFVHNNENYPQVFIQGYKNLNRAINDDIVAIELLDETEWRVPTSLVLEEKEEDIGDFVNEKEEDTKEVEIKKSVKKLPSGRVVGIIKRNWRPYCGILKVSDIPDATRHLFIPAERRIPRIRIETRQANMLKNHRIIVNVDCWPRDSRYPLGHFVKCLGEIGDKETENQVILLEHDVPFYPFPPAVLDCLPQLPWIITEDDKKARLDLRHLQICSVDPPGCTDIDDALHCLILPNGNYQCGVHIADVSHFIRPGTAIDDEANRRSTTVYLVDKRIDMVPELLSSNLCSLRDDGDRFAFSVFWEMTPNADIIKTEFAKTIIRSKASLTYAQAQMMIDDVNRNDELTVSLRCLNKLGKILKKRRIDNGALSLESSEVRFNLDSETHDPIDVYSKELKETNSMVEEFMLLANVTVARKIYESFPECACLRRHPAPPISNYDPLIKAAESHNIKINCENGKQLADSLETAVVEENPYFNIMLRMLTTRCMMQALYCCSGMFPESEYNHYGLAAPIYTHFTSPIRRYADIIVHRLLAAAIQADVTYADLLDKHKLQQICNNMNFRHKMAQYAGRASVNLHTQLFFKNRKVDEEGYILFVKKNALQVLIPKYGLEGTLYLDNVSFIYNEQEPSQTIGNCKLKLFQRLIIQISIDSSNVQHQKMILKLVYPKIEGLSVDPTNTELIDNIEQPIKKKLKK